MKKIEIDNDMRSFIIIFLLLLLACFITVGIHGCKYDPVGCEISCLSGRDDKTYQEDRESQTEGNTRSQNDNIVWHISGR